MDRQDPLADHYRELWRQAPIFTGSIDFRGKAGGMGSRPDEVLLNGSCLAYAKLAVSQTGVPEGAHEYLAFRLADIFGLYVPPVGFWTDAGGTKYSLSVRAFPSSITLEDARPCLTDIEMHGLRSAFAKAVVFHTWIADIDHNDNEGNVIVDDDSPAGHPRIAFIDHAMSLSHSWRENSARAYSPENYYLDIENLAAEELSEAILRVIEISERTIKLLIQDVPAAFLAPDKAALVYRCLERRKGELPEAFARFTGAPP